MPTYEYQCSECNAVYDLQQSFSAETTHTCEECGKGIAKRVLHAPRVVFKGSGWYATDSRNSNGAVSDNAPAAAAGDDSSAATSTSSGEGSSAAAAS